MFNYYFRDGPWAWCRAARRCLSRQARALRSEVPSRTFFSRDMGCYTRSSALGPCPEIQATKGVEMGELWLCRFASRPHSRLRLLCFPHAGGSAAIFRGWTDALPDLDVCAVQLPGRAARHREQPLTSISAIVEALSLIHI